MIVFKSRVKETTEDRLQKAINLGREEALKEVIEWLDENAYAVKDSTGIPFVCLQYFCDDKEEVLQSFKERFNIE